MQILFSRQDCGRCSFGVPIWSDTCPRCGLILHSAKRLRVAGALYLAIGLLLSAAAAYLIVLIAGISRSGDPQAKTRFSGGGWEATLIFGALSFVLLLGVIGILMGVWQIRHGRRNPKLVRIVIVLYLIFWAGAMLIRSLT
jgi:hypothetical protein